MPTTFRPPGFENLMTSLHKGDSISSYSENQQLIDKKYFMSNKLSSALDNPVKKAFNNYVDKKMWVGG